MESCAAICGKCFFQLKIGIAVSSEKCIKMADDTLWGEHKMSIPILFAHGVTYRAGIKQSISYLLCRRNSRVVWPSSRVFRHSNADCYLKHYSMVWTPIFAKTSRCGIYIKEGHEIYYLTYRHAACVLKYQSMLGSDLISYPRLFTAPDNVKPTYYHTHYFISGEVLATLYMTVNVNIFTSIPIVTE